MAETPNNPSTPHFDIHPSVVFRLGDELITDEIQALVELIKNSYDADATYARVHISTQELLGDGHAYPGARGYISIEDDGVGMNEATITNGWLVISNSSKAIMKTQGLVTRKYGRTPQGDKGLGRLGSQRLGYNLEIFTKPENEDVEYHVAFNWRDFLQSERLSNVEVKFDKITPTKKSGTRIVISDLRNIDVWGKVNALKTLTNSLSRLISPFQKIRNYRVNISIDGLEIELAQMAEELRQTAQLRYEIKFKNNIFSVEGAAKLDYFNPLPKDKVAFRQLVEADNGKALLEYLSSGMKGKDFNIRSSNKGGWYIEFGFSTPFDSLDKLLMEGKDLANPGPFDGEIDFYDFGEGLQNQNIFNRLSEYKQYIRDLSGIGIYRDGFGIRVDSDWLNLRSSATSGRSRYVLRPDNTIGYIAISTADNPNLRETTNREGFIQNSYYANFSLLLKRFIAFSEQVQEHIRRGWVSFREEAIKKDVQASVVDTSTQNLSNEIQRRLQQAEKHSIDLKRTVDQMNEVVRNEPINTTDKSVSHAMQQSLNETSKILNYLDDLSNVANIPQVIVAQVQQLESQLSQGYEMMSLGLTAEALSHEIANITRQLGDRTEQIARHIKQNNIKDVRMLSYVEHVRGSISGLRKQLSHFTPSLRYVRHKREDIQLSRFFNDLALFYKERFSEKRIEIKSNSPELNDFSININKGKLTQIFDNLLLNSEYWVQEDIRLKHIPNGLITIEIDKPYIRLFDNGRGIDPSIETTLFEPFVTLKSENKGRGLGLFIIQQLLDSEGCHIYLLPKRNEYNRLYVFELNMTNRVSSNA